MGTHGVGFAAITVIVWDSVLFSDVSVTHTVKVWDVPAAPAVE